MKKKVFTFLGALLIICVPTITVLAATTHNGYIYHNKKRVGQGTLIASQNVINTDVAVARTFSNTTDIPSCTTFLTANRSNGMNIRAKSAYGEMSSEIINFQENCSYFRVKCSIHKGSQILENVILTDK